MENLWHLVIGGASGCTATMIIQPIDMIKVRLQIKNEEFGILRSQGKPVPNIKLGFLPMAKTIISESGPVGLYSGLSSALMRQVFYATTRLGLFKIFSEKHKERTQST
jgi:solute carrier family 25 oxoglutarate transporter 11